MNGSGSGSNSGVVDKDSVAAAVVLRKEAEEEEGATIFKIGQRVEVSSDEEGFKGAWFVGRVVESNRKSKTKLLIQYETLLADDGKRPLKEYITIPFIRPQPPSLLDTHSFQTNDLVDAFHRDAWWVGVITRALDLYQFVVSFKNPREDITFSGFQLRFHLDWRDGKWIRPQSHQEMERREVGDLDTKKFKRSKGKQLGKPSKVRKSGTSATGDNKINNSRKGDFEEIIDTDNDTREFQDKNPTEENNGVEEVTRKRKRGRPKLLLLKSTGQNIKKRESKTAPQLPPLPPPLPLMNSPPSSTTTDIQSNEERNKGRPAAVTSSPSTQVVQSTHERKKRGRPPYKKRIINSVETTKGSVKDSGETCTGETSHSKVNNKVNDDEMPSSDDFHGLLTFSKEEGISSQTIMHDDLRVLPGLCVLNQQDRGDRQIGNEIIIATDEEKEEEKEEFVGPFEKCSPLWKTIESMQVFKKTPQKPHFSSLSKCEEQFREGLAIGCMVTFASTVDRISKLQISDPTSVIDRYLETLAELEYHGFNVEIFRACLKELLAKKARESQLQEESKKVVSEIAERRLKKTKLENAISEIEARIAEQKQKHGDIILKKESMDEEIGRLQLKKDQINEDITNVRLKFQNIAASPL